MKFHTTPTSIEAVRVSDAIVNAGDNWKGLPQWLVDAADIGGITFSLRTITIGMPSRHRVAVAEFDDWIIRDEEGTLHPCSDLLFQKMYVDEKTALAAAKTDEIEAARYRWLRSRTFSFSVERSHYGVSGSMWGDWPDNDFEKDVMIDVARAEDIGRMYDDKD